MFDPEQYANTQYYSRYVTAAPHIDPATQTAFLPYFHPSYRQGLGTSCNVPNLPNGKTDTYICKWIDPDTHRICNRAFAYMQDIGKLNASVASHIVSMKRKKERKKERGREREEGEKNVGNESPVELLK